MTVTLPALLGGTCTNYNCFESSYRSDFRPPRNTTNRQLIKIKWHVDANVPTRLTRVRVRITRVYQCCTRTHAPLRHARPAPRLTGRGLLIASCYWWISRGRPMYSRLIATEDSLLHFFICMGSVQWIVFLVFDPTRFLRKNTFMNRQKSCHMLKSPKILDHELQRTPFLAIRLSHKHKIWVWCRQDLYIKSCNEHNLK